MKDVTDNVMPAFFYDNRCEYAPRFDRSWVLLRRLVFCPSLSIYIIVYNSIYPSQKAIRISPNNPIVTQNLTRVVILNGSETVSINPCLI